MASENDMQAVIDAARLGVAHDRVDRKDSAGVLVSPVDLFVTDLEQYLPAPTRKRGSVTVFDVASFNQVIADNKDAGTTSIYLDRNPTAPSVVAVMNDNGTAGTGWGDFRVSIEFRPTPQWEKWRGMDGKMSTQATFAEFIEDNLADIADPAGGSMLEIVTYLQATRTVNFKSAVKLGNGAVQFQNIEDIDAKVSAGAVSVPETFKLALAPLQGSPVYGVPARFRYRISDGKLMLGFKLQRIEDLMQQLIDEVVAKIERSANISVLDGLPQNASR